MQAIDNRICELFYRVLKNHLIGDFRHDDVKAMKKTLPDIRRKYKGRKVKESSVHSLPSVPLSEASQVLRSAYTYECGVCLSSAIAKMLLDLKRGNEDFFTRKMGHKTINICCLAGSLGSKAVAAIEAFLWVNEESQVNHFTDLRVAFVNKDDEWETVFDAVMAELRNHVRENFKAKITPKFFAYRDSKSISHDVLEVLQKADVLLATKLSQEWCKLQDKEFRQLLTVALRYMKPDSLLFFADFSSAEFLNALETDANTVDSVMPLYKETSVFHSVSLETIAKHFECYQDYFGNDLNCSYCVLSVAAWLKRDKKYPAAKRLVSPLQQGALKRENSNSKNVVKKDLVSLAQNVEKMKKNPASFPLSSHSSHAKKVDGAIGSNSFKRQDSAEKGHADEDKTQESPATEKEMAQENQATGKGSSTKENKWNTMINKKDKHKKVANYFQERHISSGFHSSYERNSYEDRPRKGTEFGEYMDHALTTASVTKRKPRKKTKFGKEPNERLPSEKHGNSAKAFSKNAAKSDDEGGWVERMQAEDERATCSKAEAWPELSYCSREKIPVEIVRADEHNRRPINFHTATKALARKLLPGMSSVEEDSKLKSSNDNERNDGDTHADTQNINRSQADSAEFDSFLKSTGYDSEIQVLLPLASDEKLITLEERKAERGRKWRGFYYRSNTSNWRSNFPQQNLFKENDKPTDFVFSTGHSTTKETGFRPNACNDNTTCINREKSTSKQEEHSLANKTLSNKHRRRKKKKKSKGNKCR